MAIKINNLDEWKDWRNWKVSFRELQKVTNLTFFSGLNSKTRDIIAVALSRDRKILATATQNGKVKLWTLDGKLIKTIPAHSQSYR